MEFCVCLISKRYNFLLDQSVNGIYVFFNIGILNSFKRKKRFMCTIQCIIYVGIYSYCKMRSHFINSNNIYIYCDYLKGKSIATNDTSSIINFLKIYKISIISVLFIGNHTTLSFKNTSIYLNR